MNRYSPTSLTLFERCCPHAYNLYQQGKQEGILGEKEFEVEGPGPAEIGIAFHAIVHAAALATKAGEDPDVAMKAHAVALGGKIAPDRVNDGYELAKQFVEWWQFNTAWGFEHGMAFDKNWKPADWKDCRFRMVFDAVGMQVMEHEWFGELNVAVAQDYKTGWAVREDELQSVQMDFLLQALQVKYPDADAYRLDIVAVRFGQVFRKLYVKEDEENFAELWNRKKRLELYVQMADNADGTPRYGYGCSRCNFTEICGAFQKRLAQIREMTGNETDLRRDPVEMARDSAVLATRSKEIEAILRVIAEKDGPIAVDGMLLGYHPEEKRALKDDFQALKTWIEAYGLKLDEGTMSMFRAYMRATGSGVTALEKVVKECAKKLGYATKKEAVEVEMPKHVEVTLQPKWGWKKATEEAAKAAADCPKPEKKKRASKPKAEASAKSAAKPELF